jgi:hypothetical protein
MVDNKINAKEVGVASKPGLLSKRNIIIAVVLLLVIGAAIFLIIREPKIESEVITGEVIVEEDRIIDAGKLKIVTNEEPPTNYYSEGGEVIGTTVDIVKEIKRVLDIDTEIEIMPWARAYDLAKTSPNVVAFTVGRTQERIDHGFHFIGPVITRKHSLWAKKDSGFSIDSIQDIKDQNFIIGAMRGDWREKYFVDEGITVDDSTTQAGGLQKLLDDKVDLWISSDIEAPRITEELDVDMEEIEMIYVFREAASYMMLSRDTPGETVKEWEDAYAEIQKTDFFEKASEKWSEALDSEVGYAKDTGFFIKT